MIGASDRHPARFQKWRAGRWPAHPLQVRVGAGERIPQARALLLPSANITANVAATRIEQESNNELITPSFVRSPTTQGYTFTLSQPVFRPQNLVQRDQADYQAFCRSWTREGSNVTTSSVDVQVAQLLVSGA